MRRRRQPRVEAPAHFVRLVPEDWHPTDLAAAVAQWQAARFRWIAEHRDVIDVVEFIRGGREERRRVMGMTPDRADTGSP